VRWSKYWQLLCDDISAKITKHVRFSFWPEPGRW
jgi:hypothetical protein